MPIYEYRREDGTVIEAIQKFSDEPLSICPETGQKVERMISESSFQLKGSGWYKTDYAASGSKATNSSSTKSSGESSDSSSKTESAGTCGSTACATGCQGANS